jgi:hypothetical protein
MKGKAENILTDKQKASVKIWEFRISASAVKT